MSVVIETSIGDLTVDLFTKTRPKACYNFLKLCKIKYYNYTLIFEVKKNFVVRFGYPTHTGTGGESIYYCDKSKSSRKKYFRAEKLPVICHNKKGLLSMVNNGKDQHGSQFIITLGADVGFLDQQGHTVFGQIAEGWDTLEEINRLLVDDKERPYRDTCISHTVVLDDPFSDPPFAKELIRARSPDIPDHLVNSERVGIYDDLNDGKTTEEIEAENDIRDRGDFEKPSENVLFICKLNPITEEGDLKRIFSRFGRTNSVKIVRDPETGNSLQYGFIEFVNRDDCEKAFLKMNNVTIDDRRVHVDFSQSVAKFRKKAFR